MTSLPILYSLQRCPYAMRARLGLLTAQQSVILRSVTMKALPQAMLSASPIPSIPLLVFDDGSIIQESIDIMLWALHQQDSQDILLHKDSSQQQIMLDFITYHDTQFIPALEQYKQASRYHRDSTLSDRNHCESILRRFNIEQRLAHHQNLMGKSPTLADYALLPFLRQFSRVHRQWFLSQNYSNTQSWLDRHCQSHLYAQAMIPYPTWHPNSRDCLFPIQNS